MTFKQQAERSIIGTLIMSPNLFASVQSVLKESDFEDNQLRWIYRAMNVLWLKNKSYTEYEVYEWLKYNYNSQITISELVVLSDEAVSSNTLLQLCYRLKDSSIRRRLARRLYEIVTKIHKQYMTADEALGEVEKVLTPLYKELPQNETNFQEDVRAVLEELSRGEGATYKTGYTSLDWYGVGGKDGELIIVGARTSVGKTAFAINWLRNFARQQIGKAVFFSLEMTRKELVQRLLVLESGVHSNKIFLNPSQLTQEDWGLLSEAVARMRDWDVDIYDTVFTIDGIRQVLQHLTTKGRKPKIVFVDYLQLVQSEGRTEEEAVAKVSKELKILAKQLGIVIVAIAQLNRQVEYRSDKRPRLADLRQSGRIEQDADRILLLHRPILHVSNPDELLEALRKIPKYAALDYDTAERLTIVYIEKNRNGATGEVPMGFWGERFMFAELEGL